MGTREADNCHQLARSEEKQVTSILVAKSIVPQSHAETTDSEADN